MLQRVLAEVTPLSDPNVLVSFDKADDAGVYLLESGVAVVQTVDFFTPVVDDPRDYGRIAAVNALSDIYAMGGIPRFALSIIAFPDDLVEEEALIEIVKGGTEKMREAGVPVIGGHSVRDPEMKFGYAVTGTVDPAHILTNAGARPGDSLVLTKPLGLGIITTGIKFGKTPAAVAATATEWMLQLNGPALRALDSLPLSAATDITGYGLIGHAYELAAASKVTLILDGSAIPVIEGTRELAAKGMLPGGIEANRKYAAGEVNWAGMDRMTQQILLDPQTAGGLLVSLPSEYQEQALSNLRNAGLAGAGIGQVVKRGEHLIELRDGR